MSDAIQLVAVSGAALIAVVALARPMWRRRSAPASGAACAKCAAGPSPRVIPVPPAQSPGEQVRPR